MEPFCVKSPATSESNCTYQNSSSEERASHHGETKGFIQTRSVGPKVTEPSEHQHIKLRSLTDRLILSQNQNLLIEELDSR